MPNRRNLLAGVILALLVGRLVLLVRSAAGDNPKASPSQSAPDAIADAQTPKEVPVERPEQKKTAHDRSDVFAPCKALPTTEALTDQTDQGRFLGFDLYKDPIVRPTVELVLTTYPKPVRRRIYPETELTLLGP